jgi:DNA-binding beta-propeller fold protein YncE
VQLFDANGTFQAAFGRGDIIDSGGVEIDASGNALVSDDLANELMVFAPDGHVVRSFGEPGNGPGQLHFPTGLALAGSVLYVADSEHDRVVRFDLASGKPTGYWAAGKFPQGLAVDGAGAVYAITDSGLLSKYVLS